MHEEVIGRVTGCAEELGFAVLALEYSPVRGPEGNIEYLVYLGTGESVRREESAEVHAVVKAAHEALD